MHNITKRHPQYEGINSVTSIELDSFLITMQPVSINEVLKFFKNTKPGCSFNLMDQAITAEVVEGGDMDQLKMMERDNELLL